MQIEEMKKLTGEMFELKRAIDDLDKHKKELKTELDLKKSVVMSALEAGEMKSFVTGKMRCTKVDKRSVKVLDRNLFLNWLETRGELRDSLNVTAATANKIYNTELEIAQEQNDLTIIVDGIPGLSEPETFSTIQLYGGK